MCFNRWNPKELGPRARAKVYIGRPDRGRQSPRDLISAHPGEGLGVRTAQIGLSGHPDPVPNRVPNGDPGSQIQTPGVQISGPNPQMDHPETPNLGYFRVPSGCTMSGFRSRHGPNTWAWWPLRPMVCCCMLLRETDPAKTWSRPPKRGPKWVQNRPFWGSRIRI